eukprot:TRINITY_DN13814_c0_g1_i1.p2 TRINITY_DN13814_c0_g1~~TRINITY_DN13814_c0_g1_i1.p2  ORF type:complete len:187 (-),score=29.92 TRINITY_DN13814_c0_g1_i1:76-591(-)
MCIRDSCQSCIIKVRWFNKLKEYLIYHYQMMQSLYPNIPKEPRRRRRRRKDKNAPKKQLPSYICYLKTRRESAKIDYPGLNHLELVTRMAEEWNNLSKEDRVVYQEMAGQDKERFEREKEEYNENYGFRRVKRNKEEGGPKRQTTAFFWYMKERTESAKAENPDLIEIENR